MGWLFSTYSQLSLLPCCDVSLKQGEEATISRNSRLIWLKLPAVLVPFLWPGTMAPCLECKEGKVFGVFGCQGLWFRVEGLGFIQDICRAV